MNKPIHPAVAEHVIEENERLRGLLAEVAHCLRTTDEQPLYWEENLASRIYRALSQQAEPACSDERPCVSCFSDDGACLAKPASAQDETLADRMRAAGMMTIDEMMAGAPLDGFIRHAGVHDLDSYGQWLDMKCREFLTMQAKRDLNKDPEDDMYEWVIAHAAAFQEARINFNAARPAQTAPQPEQSGLNDDSKEAAMQKAFELGGLEDGSYHLESDELELVIRSALTAQGPKP